MWNEHKYFSFSVIFWPDSFSFSLCPHWTESETVGPNWRSQTPKRSRDYLKNSNIYQDLHVVKLCYLFLIPRPYTTVSCLDFDLYMTNGKGISSNWMTVFEPFPSPSLQCIAIPPITPLPCFCRMKITENKCAKSLFKSYYILKA